MRFSIEGEYVPVEGDEVIYKVCAIPPKFEKVQAVEVTITHLKPGTKHETWTGNVVDSWRLHHEYWMTGGLRSWSAISVNYKGIIALFSLKGLLLPAGTWTSVLRFETKTLVLTGIWIELGGGGAKGFNYFMSHLYFWHRWKCYLALHYLRMCTVFHLQFTNFPRFIKVTTEILWQSILFSDQNITSFFVFFSQTKSTLCLFLPSEHKLLVPTINCLYLIICAWIYCLLKSCQHLRELCLFNNSTLWCLARLHTSTYKVERHKRITIWVFNQ